MFYSTSLKIQRAEHHISDLKQTFKGFVQHNPKSFTARIDTEGGQTRLVANFAKELPTTFALIIADAVHNLRVALDHANWELRGLDGGAQNRYTKLPVGENRLSYEAVCKGIKTPTDDLPEFFKALEFFKGGRGHLIYALHDLDVEDKHMFLPVMAQSIVVPALRIRGGGSRINIIGGTFMNSDGSDRPINMFVSDGPVEIEQDADPTVDIFFGNIDSFKFKPVIPTLVHLTDAVKQVIGQFETLVAARGG